MGRTVKETRVMTCDLSDVVDFLGNLLRDKGSVEVDIGGAKWTVLRGGPAVYFEYKGETISFGGNDG